MSAKSQTWPQRLRTRDLASPLQPAHLEEFIPVEVRVDLNKNRGRSLHLRLQEGRLRDSRMCKGCVEDSDEELEMALACNMGVECSYSGIGIHMIGALRVVNSVPDLAIVTASRSQYIVVKGLDDTAHPNKYI